MNPPVLVGETRRIEAVMFDWAGTTVDHGCMAPVAAFQEVFRLRGVTVSTAADEVRRPRPWPDMCLRNVMKLGVSSVAACVKVDDTLPGIEEGVRAGMWTVGVVMTGNELGCTEADLEAMRPEERARRRAEGYARLRGAGAHAVVDGIAELPGLIEALFTARGAP